MESVESDVEVDKEAWIENELLGKFSLRKI